MSFAPPEELLPLHLGSDFASRRPGEIAENEHGCWIRFILEITATVFLPPVYTAFQRPTSWKNK